MKKFFTTLGLLAVLISLGATDAFFVEGGLPEPEEGMEPDVIATEPDPQIPGDTGTSLPPGGVQKTSGPNVAQVISELSLESQPTEETSILSQIIATQEATVQTSVLLKDGDRAALIAWSESPKVKVYFLALKEALHTSFSPQVKDLLDETQRQSGRPPRNLLTFFDPGISSERLIFIRVRERLYEIHIAEGMEDTVFQLVEALSQ